MLLLPVFSCVLYAVSRFLHAIFTRIASYIAPITYYNDITVTFLSHGPDTLESFDEVGFAVETNFSLGQPDQVSWLVSG
jgi:hypothetical protein